MTITSSQMRAARVISGLTQHQLAELSGLSVPTIQRMETSKGWVRGTIETLAKLIQTFENLGVELVNENTPSLGLGIGVRLKEASFTQS